jgi:hypothetical protein
VKLAYIAAPWTADTDEEIDLNINWAEHWATRLREAGYAVLCVHSENRNCKHSMTPQYWYDATLEAMRRCDVVFIPPQRPGGKKWTESVGTVNEFKDAAKRGQRVFFHFEEAASWLNTVNTTASGWEQ